MKICPTCSNVYVDSLQSCPRDQTALVPFDQGLRPGDLLRGKYQVLEELGRGGMATVYKMRHLAFHDIVAVKLVHAELLADADFLKRFRNEAVVARQLRHPNAVEIRDFDFSDDGQPFIVMEYVNGRSLYDARLQMPQAWPAEVALPLVAGVAGALEAAHALGIVHRDIKPANILLTRTPEGREIVKVSDFGVAKVDERAFAGMTSVKTQANMIIGTPEYMSPEQAMASDATRIDGRSDLYSLGMVLYEMLTGAHPFRADTPIAMLMHQVQTQPNAPHFVQDSISSAISALILKSLRKNPEDRFQTAGEMLVALENPQAWYSLQPASTAARPGGTQEAATAMFAAPEEIASLRPSAGTPGPGTHAPGKSVTGTHAVRPLPLQEGHAPRPAGAPGKDTLRARTAGPATGGGSRPGPRSRQIAQKDPAARVSQAAGNLGDPGSGGRRGNNTKGSSFGTLVFLLLLLLAAAGVYYYLESEGLLHGQSHPPAGSGGAGGHAVTAQVQVCDPSGSCRQQFSFGVSKRLHLKLDAHRLISSGAQTVALQVVVSRKGTSVTELPGGNCTFANGASDARCDVKGVIGALSPGSYQVTVLGNGLGPLGAADLTITA